MSAMRDFEKTTFECNRETLAGINAKNDNADIPSFLFLHGAGKSDKSRVFYLMERLQNYGVSSFAFDFSGHGSSSGDLKKSSLQRRTGEAACAITKFLPQDKPITVCGSSMSGHTAIRLLDKVSNIGSLILFCPAIYDRRAYAAPFDDGFTSIIREKGSWENSEIFSLLEEYTGKLLIFIGEKDEVIPKGVIELLDKRSKKATKKEIVVIPECNHMIHTWINQRSQLADEVAEKISEFI
jgi:uncharacterized protein